MNELQKRLIELLVEFDELCEEAGVVYSLIDSALLCSERCMAIRGCEADVAMTYDGFMRFRHIFESREIDYREIESPKNNPHMPGWYFRYVNTSTTLFSYDYAHARKAHGLGINIHILRKSGFNPMSLYLSFIERGMKSRIHFSYKRFQIGRPFDPIALPIVSALCSADMPNWLYSAFERSALVDTDSSSLLSMPEAPTIKLPIGFLSDINRVTLNGSRFNASKYAVPYLARRFRPVLLNRCMDVASQVVASILQRDPGKIRTLVSREDDYWKKVKPRLRNVDYQNIWTSDVPYESFLSDIEELINDNRYWRSRERWLRNWVFSIGWRLFLQRKRWATMFYVAQYYHVWEEFEPHADDVNKLLDSGCYDLLWLYLSSYRLRVQRYMAKGFPLVGSEWLWQLNCLLYEINGKKEVAKRLDELKEKNKLGPIENGDSNQYLETHLPTDDAPISKLAEHANSSWHVDSKMVLFIGTSNSAGNMEALLEYCLSAQECTGFCFAYTVRTLSEAVHIVQIAGDQAERVRFVVAQCSEFKACISKAAYVFTTEMLPVNFVKKQEQVVVFMPDLCYERYESQKAARLLRGLMPTLFKTDLLILPSEQMKKSLFKNHSSACLCNNTQLYCDYPCFTRNRINAASDAGNEKAGVRIAISVMRRCNYKNWNSFEDVTEFARTVAMEANCLSKEIRVRIPQAVFERFAKVGSQVDEIAVGAFVGFSESVDGATSAIVDNYPDLIRAQHMGLFIIFVVSSEEQSELLSNWDISNLYIARTMKEAIARAAALSAHAERSQNSLNHFNNDTASEIIKEALNLGANTHSVRALKKVSSDLLVLRWEDTDEFHECLSWLSSIEVIVLLLRERKYWLLDSDIKAFKSMNATYSNYYFNSDSLKKLDDNRCKEEWSMLLGDVQFDKAIVPTQLADSYKKLMAHVPAAETVPYRTLKDLVELFQGE